MISVKHTDQIISKNLIEFSTTHIPLEQSGGYVLKEEIIADRDHPPFDQVATDGIAIAFSAYESGQRQFPIFAKQMAGETPLGLSNPSGSVEVMTGCVLPTGCDAVIPYEQIKRISSENGEEALISEDLKVRAMQYIHQQAAHCSKGSIALVKGTVLNSPQIGIAATFGQHTVKVIRKPNVAIITTGDELSDIRDAILPYQIRRSNSYTIQSVLDREGIAGSIFYFRDDKSDLKSQLKEIVKTFDLLILIRGSSKGKSDYVPEQIGVDRLAHQVKQDPGKSFWFGKVPAGKDGDLQRPVFALPGNPVDMLICFHRYVLPYLKQAMGVPLPNPIIVTLLNQFINRDKKTYFLPVKARVAANGAWLASPLAINSPYDLISLAESDGFIELPSEMKFFPAGYKTAIYQWV
ncbi:MAG: hypothetical protein B6244_09835 [Candidatus Cloacimonetes bacterium 4572_55]|nr:MAG: hypothetical protein B6244_09835 [Candidatus Cloacimonetes bacterium 4572_55]